MVEFGMPQKKIIYDLGSNNGDDIPYYLKKADLVVAVEANPVLCEQIRNRFGAELASGHLVLENRVLTADTASFSVPFFVHKTKHVLSQLPRPDDRKIGDFDEVALESIAVGELISRWGAPHYIKVDLERYDAEILQALFDQKIFPPFISAESHDAKVFSLLVACGGYDAFKLVDGASVAEEFEAHGIAVGDGSESYSFPHHSAGPFGEDIPGEWRTANEFLPLLGRSGLGWKDIHAARRPAIARAGGARSISFITVCKGRLDHIKQTLPLLCKEEPHEIIVVDYDCPQKVGDWVRANFPQVKVVHLNDGQSFNVARGRNFGAKHASGEWLCFIDADIKVNPGFVDWLHKNVSEGCFYRAEPVDGERDKETWGTVICHKGSFQAAEGYDDFYRGWGGEDCDLYYKLERFGYREQPFPAGFVQAISHQDDLRLAAYEVKEKAVHLVENRLYHLAKRVFMEFADNTGESRNDRGELPAAVRNAIHDQIHDRILEWVRGGRKGNVNLKIETKKKTKRVHRNLPEFSFERELRIVYRIRLNRAKRARERLKIFRKRLRGIFRRERSANHSDTHVS